MIELIPAWFSTYIAVVAFIFGAVIGSFLNVVIYRFHTGKSLNGNSHCMSCQRRLRWFELFPLLSYIILRARCRTCHSYIPLRYFLVEVVTGFGFLAIYLQVIDFVHMGLFAVLLSLLIIIAVYDLYHYIIPDVLVILVAIIVVLFYVYDMYSDKSLSMLLPALLSSFGAFAFYGGLWKVSNGRWLGFGDVKLAVPFGFLAGYPAVFSMIVLSFWVGAMVSITLLIVQLILKRGQIPLRIFGSPLKMKSEIPFAPFLIAGFILSYFYGVDVLALVAYVLS